MRALLSRLMEKMQCENLSQLASKIGYSATALTNMQDENADAQRLADFISKVVQKTKKTAQANTCSQSIKPIVEFAPLERLERKTTHDIGMQEMLKSMNGVYIFYDSIGKALYAGKAKEQTLLEEIKSVKARDRNQNQPRQTMKTVSHSERNTLFTQAIDNTKRPKTKTVYLYDIAKYFSAYEVEKGMIDSVEALLVRAFCNNLLNIQMPTFPAENN